MCKFLLSLFRIRTYITCPYRMGKLHDGNFDRIEHLDYWRKIGKDRVCSFCGSWHPDEFLPFIQDVVNSDCDMGSIDFADNSFKIYVNRSSIRSASEGAIKFKMHHLSDKDRQKYYLLIRQAADMSWKKFANSHKRIVDESASK